MKAANAIRILSTISLSLSVRGEDDGVVFFREEVKPILAGNCFKCHGGADERGETKVRGGLQLISRKGLLRGGDRGPAVDLEAPERSLLLRALSYEDEDLQMPPRTRLDPDQMTKIRTWLGMGAPWTPEDENLLVELDEPRSGRTEVSEATRAHWSYRPLARPDVPAHGNPVDVFLNDAMRAQGLEPVPEAPRAELLRRLAYDLTGLPPTMEELRSFERDTRPGAWEREVERLLASPAYGEKWARHWLDVVRYAESNGFERDADKPFVWRYRDYVIRSFNGDKPYDRFVTEQLAGDEVGDPDIDSLTATGFFRLMQWDDEPADGKQHEFDVLDDALRVTSEGLLGMTLGCARCHDHKGDPIPQTDYYRFLAFFRGLQPMVRAGNMSRKVRQGEGLGPEEVERLEREEAALRLQLEEIEGAAVEALRQRAPHVARKVLARGESLISSTRSRDWSVSLDPPAEDWSTVGYRAEGPGWTPGLPPIPPSREAWIHGTFGLTEIPESVVLRLAAAESLEIYLNGRLLQVVPGTESLQLSMPMMEALQTGRNAVAIHKVGSEAPWAFALEAGGWTASEVVLREELEAVPDKKRRRYQELQEALETVYRRRHRQELEVLAVSEVGRVAPPTHVHIRGNAHAEGGEVLPGFPEIWGGAPAGISPQPEDRKSSGRRLALAEWIASPDNPRTARVMVNRIWQHHFGRGLCPTPNDFGFLGEGTRHPELLDWLATEFIRQGWSVKAMHRLILGSEAYRRASYGGPAAARIDPANEWLWRFNPRRLTAEEIRDSLLVASGRLNRRMYGPSVYLQLPEAVLATSSTGEGKWGTSSPEEMNRRSVYVKVKRSLMPPLFRDFDFADTDNSCPVRFTTTVPTQALAMLNSDFAHDNAESLAGRLEDEGLAGDDQQVRRTFQLLLGREPGAGELQRAVDFLREQRENHGLEKGEALRRFTLAAINFNEFVHLD